MKETQHLNLDTKDSKMVARAWLKYTLQVLALRQQLRTLKKKPGRQYDLQDQHIELEWYRYPLIVGIRSRSDARGLSGVFCILWVSDIHFISLR